MAVAFLLDRRNAGKGEPMWATIASVGGWVLFGVLLVGWVRSSVLERNFFTKNGWRGRLE